MDDKDILELVENNHLLYQLTPSLIHEFNNIFTAIVSTTQLMIGYEDNIDNMRQGFKDIQTYIEKAVSLNKLIASYVIENNSKKISTDQFYQIFAEIIEKEVKANNSKIIYKHTEIKTILISSDILKVLFQLVVNAQDELFKTEITIKTAISGLVYVIEVIDNGKFIENKENLFKLAFTTKKTRLVNDRYKRRHFGVGLSLSKFLVEKENGTLEYLREDEKNIFKISLPIQ